METTYVQRLGKKQKEITDYGQKFNVDRNQAIKNLEPRIKVKNSLEFNKKLLNIPLPSGLLPRSRLNNVFS